MASVLESGWLKVVASNIHPSHQQRPIPQLSIGEYCSHCKYGPAAPHSMPVSFTDQALHRENQALRQKNQALQDEINRLNQELNQSRRIIRCLASLVRRYS